LLDSLLQETKMNPPAAEPKTNCESVEEKATVKQPTLKPGVPRSSLKNYTRRIGPVLANAVLEKSEKDNDSFLLPSVVPTDQLANDTDGISEVRRKLWKNPHTPPDIRLPKIVYMICELGEGFDKALEEITAAPVIGLKLEGVKINRRGELSSLGITTSSAVFIFDIDQLQEAVFQYGLRWVLESKTILKIVHDVRRTSDMLFHDYQVKLSNVFDTAVADTTFHASLLKDNKVPKFFRSYQSLCVDYLGIPETALFFHVHRANRLEEDARLFWSSSPFTSKMVLALARNCMYLLPLHEICKRALLYHFNLGTDLFLNQMRGSNSYEASILAGNMENNPNQIPQSLKELLQGDEDEEEQAQAQLVE